VPQADDDRTRLIDYYDLGQATYAMMAFLIGLGYPAGRPLAPLAKPGRRPVSEVIHHGHW
jgi:hypothetical protein